MKTYVPFLIPAALGAAIEGTDTSKKANVEWDPPGCRPVPGSNRLGKERCTQVKKLVDFKTVFTQHKIPKISDMPAPTPDLPADTLDTLGLYTNSKDPSANIDPPNLPELTEKAMKFVEEWYPGSAKKLQEGNPEPEHARDFEILVKVLEHIRQLYSDYGVFPVQEVPPTKTEDAGPTGTRRKKLDIFTYEAHMFADPHQELSHGNPKPACCKGVPCLPAGLPSCEEFHRQRGTKFHEHEVEESVVEKRDIDLDVAGAASALVAAIPKLGSSEAPPPEHTPVKYSNDPWLSPVCMKEYKFLFYTYHIRIPHGALYCDTKKHCGSGFWDNIRPHQATGWTCDPIEKDSLEISFNVPLGISDHTIAHAVYLASAGHVAVFCEPGTQKDAEVRWEAAKNRPLNVYPDDKKKTDWTDH